MAQHAASKDLQYLRECYQADVESGVIEFIYEQSGYNKETTILNFRNMGFKYPCKQCTFLNESTANRCVMCGNLESDDTCVKSKYDHIRNKHQHQQFMQQCNWTKTKTKNDYIYAMEQKMQYSQLSPSKINHMCDTNQNNRNTHNNQVSRHAAAAIYPANQFCEKGKHDMVETRPENHEVHASKKKGHNHSAHSNTNARAKIGPFGAFGSAKVSHSSSVTTSSYNNRQITIKSSGVTRYLYCKKCPFSKQIFDPNAMATNAENFIGK